MGPTTKNFLRPLLSFPFPIFLLQCRTASALGDYHESPIFVLQSPPPPPWLHPAGLKATLCSVTMAITVMKVAHLVLMILFRFVTP